MSKRTANTYIDEKTFEDIDLNKQADKKSESNSSDEDIKKSKKNVKNLIANDESASCHQKKPTIKELKSSNEETTTELNKIGAQSSAKAAEKLVQENSLMFKSLFENRGQLKLAQSLFGDFTQKEIPTYGLLSYCRRQNDKKSLICDAKIAKKEGLFNNPVNKEGLFNNPVNKEGLSNNPIDILNLCSEREQSIFNFSSWRNRPKKQANTGPNSQITNPDNEQQGQSAELQKEQLLEADPLKSQKRFEYPVNCSITMKVKILKYKKDTSDLIENLLLTVLHDEPKGTYYITISLQATKNAIYSGIISPGKSKIRKLNEKDSFEILVFSLTNDKPKKLQSNRLKITILIEAEDSAAKFMEKMTQIIESQPK